MTPIYHDSGKVYLEIQRPLSHEEWEKLLKFVVEVVKPVGEIKKKHK